MAGFLPLREVGLFGVGSSFGQALKLFLSGFEFAWAPFYLGSMHRADARQLFSRLGTYLFAAVVLLAAGLSAVSSELVRLMTTARIRPGQHGHPVDGDRGRGAGVLSGRGDRAQHHKAHQVLSRVHRDCGCGERDGECDPHPQVRFHRRGVGECASYSVLTLLIGYFASRVYPVQVPVATPRPGRRRRPSLVRGRHASWCRRFATPPSASCCEAP